MSRRYSLAYLSTAPLSAPDMVELAAQLGYDHIGIRLTTDVAPGAKPLVLGASVLRDVVLRCRHTGVSVYDAEVVWLRSEFRIDDYAGLLDAANVVGARTVLVICDDPNERRATDSFAKLCNACGLNNLTAHLEFMPGTPVPDARTAVRIVSNAGCANGRVLVDSIHVARSGTSMADLAAIPGSMIEYAQICDAPLACPETMEEIRRVARFARLLPGEGELDLATMFAHLPDNLPISVEIPNEARLAELGAKEWARRGLAMTKRVLDVEPGIARATKPWPERSPF
jgi:sugar phosphate isomerase/epimerase